MLPASHATVTAWRNGNISPAIRMLPEEVAVALTYDRVSFAVMMATPQELEDFACGFSLSEGIIERAADIIALDIVEVEAGIECRMSLTAARRERLETRRRKIAGPVGCGLCGIDSLNEAIRPAKRVTSDILMRAEEILHAFETLSRAQKLNQVTRAVHAAAFFSRGNLLAREDVGRHNALDKVIGAAINETSAAGAILLTSRVSIELIQKTAAFGAPILAAISVPTARAVREAHEAGITLIAIARDDGFEIFTHPERIIWKGKCEVA